MNTISLQKGTEYYYKGDGIFVIFLYMDGGKAVVEDGFGVRWAVYPEQLEEVR